MVYVNKRKLEEILNECKSDPDRKIFYELLKDVPSVISEIPTVYSIYATTLRIIERADDDALIKQDPLFYCYVLGKIMSTSVYELMKMELNYQTNCVHVKDEKKLPHYKNSDNGDLIYKYTAEDAVRDGVFMKVGFFALNPVYLTSNLYNEGYEDESKLENLIERGVELLTQRNYEDSDYLRLRVVEKGRIWVVQTGEGITFMKPEEY